MWLFAQAWTEFLYLDLVGLLGFKTVSQMIKRTKTRSIQAREDTVTRVVSAAETACAFYPKPAKCLQRSAVVTRLLRRHGVDARLIIGCHLPPLQAHAWVEVDGGIISDYQDGLEHYRELDRW
jgi:Transglutaminase-like superfamily